MDPTWFGLIMLLALEVGYTTPPFGLMLFVMKRSKYCVRYDRSLHTRSIDTRCVGAIRLGQGLHLHISTRREYNRDQ
jgi:hypothetical protein